MRLRKRRVRLSVAPVIAYAPPRYPTLVEFADLSETLLKYVPPRWQRCRLALSALTAFALGQVVSADDPVGNSAAPSVASQSAEDRPVATRPEAVPVAPVFVHGQGRGAIGCVVVSPPTFLSEAEALEILWDEIKDAGLGFERRPEPVKGVSAKPPFPFLLDFYSPRYRLGVAVVGMFNYAELQEEDGPLSTVTEIDTLSVAQRIVERLRAKGEVSAGIFYDPLVVEQEVNRKRSGGVQDDAARRNTDLLRAQIRDFVEWSRTRLANPASDTTR